MSNTIWLIDSEWGYRDGRINYETAVTPVVFCAQKYRSTERYSFWGRDHGLKSFMLDHRNDFFVSHNVVAQLSG